MANIHYNLGLAALTGLFLATNAPVTHTQTPTAPSQETLVDKLKEYVRDGEIKPGHYNHSKDFVSQEWDDGTYICKTYTLGNKKLLAFHLIGQEHFRLPHSQYGLGLSISAKPYWYIFEGRQYQDKDMDGIGGNEIDVTDSQNEAQPKKNKENPTKVNQRVALLY